MTGTAETFDLVIPGTPLVFDGERFTSTIKGQIEHLHRYFLVRDLCRGKQILDVGSGRGYGAHLLAGTAASVIGVEIDPAAVDHARASYRNGNLTFLEGEPSALPLPDHSVDVVISFETFEGFSEHERFLSEVRRVLRLDGVFVISTPDRDVYSAPDRPSNPHYLPELSRSEFDALISRHFHYHQSLLQSPLIGSAIVPVKSAAGAADPTIFARRSDGKFLKHSGLPSAPYLVAIASNNKLPSLDWGLYIETSELAGREAELAIEKKKGVAGDLWLREHSEKLEALSGEIERLAAENQRLAAVEEAHVALGLRFDALAQQLAWTERSVGYRAHAWIRSGLIAFVGRARQRAMRLGIPRPIRHALAGAARRLLPGRVFVALLPDIAPPSPENWSVGKIARLLRPLPSIPTPARPILLEDAEREERVGSHPWPSRSSVDPAELPIIDISCVTFNSERWLPAFFESLCNQEYPLERLNIILVDNGSADGTVTALDAFRQDAASRFRSVQVFERSNRGFGQGHNWAIAQSSASFVLVTNVDLSFEYDTLTRLVARALADTSKSAAWEARQKPYEHPKYYDFITGETGWCSGACVLLRRAALDQVGGFEPRIFMYAEDVELSYRLRSYGWHLRYVPEAVVWHYAYENTGITKPLQYSGSVFGSLLIRMRYGSWKDIGRGLHLSLALYRQPSPVPGHRKLIRRALSRIVLYAVPILARRRTGKRKFGFLGFDYEMHRPDPFYEHGPLLSRPRPPVSIIMRTYGDRDGWRRQAIRSVLAQTHDNVELVLVEDGGERAAALVDELRRETTLNIIYEALPKVGRSAAGNRGLALATGSYLMFLDDDDALFAEHIETLVNELAAHSASRLAYAYAWEVRTLVGPGGASDYEEIKYALTSTFSQAYSRDLIEKINLIPIQSALFHRSLYDEAGGFDESLDLLEDWNLWLRYSRLTDFRLIPKTTSIYRIPADEVVAAARAEAMNRFHEIAQRRGMEATREQLNPTVT